MQTLFDKYGGFASFQQLTRNFYSKVLDSEQLNHYFVNVKMETLIAHQVHFLVHVLGGPKGDYDHATMKNSHFVMQISHNDFDEMVELLGETLEDAEIDVDDLYSILKIVEQYRGYIVNAKL